MPQIFHRSFNVISRLTIFGFLGFVALLAWVVYIMVRSPNTTDAYIALEQPIPFSHAHHAGQLGIDCRYCHTSVETSHFAGIPPTKTCMNCHSQIWVNSPLLQPVRESYATNTPIEWNRVHRLADFAHFHHAIHVNKGVGCSSCHGRVDQMPLTMKVNTLQMEWCLDCHRNPEPHLRPKEEIFNMDWQPPADQAERGRQLAHEYGIKKYTNCSACHY